MKPIPVFVGYDPREAIAYHVCANSIIRNSSAPVAIIPIALNLFKDYDGDIVELYEILAPGSDVAVVKHDYKTRMPIKYLGAKNEDYPRKNWSSVIVWNCASAANQQLTHEFVQGKPGSFLHRFSWISDDHIQALPAEWNWLPDEYGANPAAKLLHYTLGTPCFHEFADTPQGEEWHRERILTEYCQQRAIG